MIKELRGAATRDPNKLPRGLLFQPDPSKNKEAGYKPKHGHASRHVDHPWRHLYRAPCDMIVHASILNQHFDYLCEYIERGNCRPSPNGGADVNQKDFSDWTPLHMAAYMGNIKFLRYILSRQYVYLHEKNDEGKTPILLAIEAGNVFDEENAVLVLLERGTELDEDVWHKLLILSLNYDIVGYSRLAYRQGINLHNCKEETKISLHKAVCCHAVKILKYYSETFSMIEIKKMIEEPDYQGLNCIEYARLTERPEILDMVEKMRTGLKVEIPVKKDEEIE
jgi:hypothetical protein